MRLIALLVIRSSVWFGNMSNSLTLQCSNDLLYAVKLHLAANSRRPGTDQRRVALLVRRNRDDGQARMSGATLTNELLTLAVIEIVVSEHQLEATGREIRSSLPTSSEQP